MIKIWEDKAGEWRFSVVGENGEPMATSEGYSSKANAIRGYKDLRTLIEKYPALREV